MADIICTNLVNGELVSNYATFKNSINQNHNLGTCNFGMPTFNDESGKWEILDISGTNAQGNNFEYAVLEVDGDFEDFETYYLNPTKVFWFIVKKLKALLCPSCM